MLSYKSSTWVTELAQLKSTTIISHMRARFLAASEEDNGLFTKMLAWDMPA